MIIITIKITIIIIIFVVIVPIHIWDSHDRVVNISAVSCRLHYRVLKKQPVGKTWNLAMITTHNKWPALSLSHREIFNVHK